jgi:hypothetical protein
LEKNELAARIAAECSAAETKISARFLVKVCRVTLFFRVHDPVTAANARRVIKKTITATGQYSAFKSLLLACFPG